MTSVPPAGQPLIPPSTFSTALPIQPNYTSSERDLWEEPGLASHFLPFFDFPTLDQLHLSCLLHHLPGRDNKVFRAEQPTTTMLGPSIQKHAGPQAWGACFMNNMGRTINRAVNLDIKYRLALRCSADWNTD